MIFEAHNTRSPAMWRIIEDEVDVVDADVLDLGMGHGDLCFMAYASGARRVTGIDYSADLVKECNLRKVQGIYATAPIYFMQEDIRDVKWAVRGPYDLIFCCSVLPYLGDPDHVLMKISEVCEQAIIECQYAGDGPGFEWLTGDEVMEAWLRKCGFESAVPIGQTDIPERKKSRVIWLALGQGVKLHAI